MAVKPVLDLITQIFGKNALSKTIGTRTNVIRLPDASVKRLIKNDLDMARANDSQLETFRKNAEQLIADIPKMNDQELLTFKGNLQRYYDVMYPPKADVFDFETRTQVPKAGIEQLETKLGIPKDVDPNSPLGRIMTKTRQIEAEGKNLAEEFGMTDQLKEGLKGLDEVTGVGPEANRMLNRTKESMFGKDYDRKMSEGFIKNIYSKYKGDDAEGILKYYNDQEALRVKRIEDAQRGVEKTPYSIMTPITNSVINKFIKADKIQLSPGMRENMLKGDRSGLRGKPVETFETYFGRDALEALDNFVDEAGSSFGTTDDLADEFIKQYPNLIRDGGELRAIKPDRDLLTFEEKVNFLTGNLNEKGPLSKSLKEYYSKNIDPFDPDLTSYIMQYVKDGPERTREIITNLPEGYLENAPEVIQKIFREELAAGGRVGYAYGSGKKLLSVLADLGKDLKTEIRKAVDNLNSSGDKKVDADMAVDDMLDDLGIDRDEIDGYDILNAYDEAYKQISNPASSIDIDEISNLKNIGASKTAERVELMQKYPGIDKELLDKILIDDNPQRKAEVLATLDEAFRMMEKGMGTDEILQTFKKTPRTKQAGGGVAYLMGL